MSDNLKDEKGHNDRLLKMIQEQYPDYHPAMTLAMVGSDKDLLKSDPAIVVNASAKLLPYLEPQLKAIEVRGSVKADFGVLRVSLAESMVGEGERID